MEDKRKLKQEGLEASEIQLKRDIAPNHKDLFQIFKAKWSAIVCQKSIVPEKDRPTSHVVTGVNLGERINISQLSSEFGFQSNLLICLIAAESSGSNEFIIFLKISKYIFLRINNLWRHYLLLKAGYNIRDPIFIAHIRKIVMEVQKNVSSPCTHAK